MNIIPPLLNKRYQILYADPPWQYRSPGCIGKTSCLDGKHNVHYPTMTDEQLLALDIQSICEDDALLFLWVTNPKLDVGIRVMTAWGFSYITVGFVWYKLRTNPSYYTLSECELCLIGKRGRIPKPRGSRNERQFLAELRAAHSVKPNAIRDRIANMFPTQPKVVRREGPLRP